MEVGNMEKQGCSIGQMKLDPPEFDYTVEQGTSPQVFGRLHVDVVGPGNIISFTWNVTVSVNWLRLIPSQGQSGLVYVNVMSDHLPPGDYETVVPFLSDAPNSPQYLTVKVHVTPKPQPPAPLVIVTETLPNGMQNQPYQAQVQITGGTPPYTVICSGLPADFSFNNETYAITGTPSTYGEFTVIIKVKDSADQLTTKAYQVEIAEAPQPPKVAITWPNGGETVYVGQMKKITWVTDRDTNDTLDIDLWLSGSWTSLATEIPMNVHDYPWVIASTQVTDNGRIRLSGPNIGNAPQSGPISIKQVGPFRALIERIIEWLKNLFLKK
jgi:hypothetical protein